jgi:hypothetical protein
LYTPVIPVTQEVKIRRIQVQGQPRQKVSKTPPPISANKAGMVVCTCHFRYTGDIGRMTAV